MLNIANGSIKSDKKYLEAMETSNHEFCIPILSASILYVFSSYPRNLATKYLQVNPIALCKIIP